MPLQSRAAYERMLAEPNVQRALASIRAAEGTAKKVDPYRVGFSFTQIDDLSKHPGRALARNFTVKGKTKYSTASGAYQFKEGTWNEVAEKLGLTDFGPLSQDIAALAKIDERGALNAVLDGDVAKFAQKVNNEWASFPGSPYGQRTVSQKTIQDAWDSYDSFGPPGIGPKPRTIPTPMFARDDYRQIAAARDRGPSVKAKPVPSQGLLAPRPTTSVVAPRGLLDTPKMAPRGLLTPTIAPRAVTTPRTISPVRSSIRAAVSPNTAVAAAIARPSSMKAVGTDITGGLAEKGRSVTGPAVAAGNLTPSQERNLADRLGRSVPAVASNMGLLGAQTALNPAAMQTGSRRAIGGLLGSAPVATTSATLSPVQAATKALASTPSTARALSPVSTATKLSPVSTQATTIPGRDITPDYGVSTYRQTPAFSTEKPQIDAIGQPPIPGLQRVTAAPPAPAIAPAVNVPARRVQAAPASVAAAPSRAVSTGLGLPSVPDAPGLGAQIASRISNAFSQNKGRMVGGLLGNVAFGPVGGLLGGYIGNRIQQNNTPQMSAAARSAMDAGTFDGFSYGPAPAQNYGLLGDLFGGLFGGGSTGFGLPGVPNAPTGARNYSVSGGNGGPSMSSAARATSGGTHGLY